jgi:hypothetical protein
MNAKGIVSVTAFLALASLSRLTANESFLAGSPNGLYRVDRASAAKIWDAQDVRKIAQVGNNWYFLTGSGIWQSGDLVAFASRNEGLPVKIIKTYDGGTKAFTREVQELKDLEVHPTNPLIMVTATKDAVYLTRDGGASWSSVGMSAATAGVKAVCALDLPDKSGTSRLTIFVSHPIYGISWKQPDVSALWYDLNDGLEGVPTVKWPDEVADLQAVWATGGTDSRTITLYASQTFMPRIYRLDWAAKKFVGTWKGTEFIDSVEGLAVTAREIVFSAAGGLRSVSLPAVGAESAFTLNAPAKAVRDWDQSLESVPGGALCAWIPDARSGSRGNLSLSELWLLRPSARSGAYAKLADGRKGLYLPVHQVTTDAGYDAHLKTIADNDLNMLVVDMKDDVGTIRYDSTDPLVLKKGRLGNGVKLEPFVRKAKERGIYLVARVVVFKDKSLYSWGGSKYAVWDKAENRAWQGYELVAAQVPASGEQGTAAAPEKTRKYNDEYWVDPYSEEVWEYNVAVAKELVARGFDEIQFDYIRFPTDGANLDSASYRWKDSGMDKESALMSFLSYARREIKAPISIDIYGANGWYRTGARTGQDVELLARYVDAICPMFYPSHFEQTFLAQSPASERPYRIFYYGSFRNTVIARGHVVVRPWAQAFYLGVSYDKAWYNADYVRREAFGARDSVNNGYTYWNNSGRYGDVKPDLAIDEPYPWESPEAKGTARPAFGAGGKDK